MSIYLSLKSRNRTLSWSQKAVIDTSMAGVWGPGSPQPTLASCLCQGKNSNLSQHRVESESEFIREAVREWATPQIEHPPLLFSRICFLYLIGVGVGYSIEEGQSGSSLERGGDFSEELHSPFVSFYGLSISDHGDMGCVAQHANF